MKRQSSFQQFHKKLKRKLTPYITLPHKPSCSFKVKKAETPFSAIAFNEPKIDDNGTLGTSRERYFMNREAYPVLEHLKRLDPVFSEIFLCKTVYRMGTAAICERYDLCPSMFWDIIGNVRRELIYFMEEMEKGA